MSFTVPSCRQCGRTMKLMLATPGFAVDPWGCPDCPAGQDAAPACAEADLHALTEEARELGTDAHPDGLRAFVSRLVDVYAGAAGRAVVEERDLLRAEVAQLRATMGALQASRDALRARSVALAKAVMRRREGAPTPERIRVAVLAAIDAVHVAPPTWAESVADDVLARLQAVEPARAWVVQLEPGVWLAPWEGDPGRTCERASAQRFESEHAASVAIERARVLRSFLAAVVEVA